MHLDPDAETHFHVLAEIIAEEITVRRVIAPEEFDAAEGIRAVAEIIADAVLDGFQVRRRTPETLRYESHEAEEVVPA